MVNTTYSSTEDMIIKLQELEGKTKMIFYPNLSFYYNEMNIRKFKLEEDLFTENAHDISKNYHAVLLLMKFLQTEPQIMNMTINYYDLYHTENRDDKEVVNNKYEDNEDEYINYDDFIIPNTSISIKPRETILR